ncbi:TPA: KxYKxGKxW signal peptide domain-containing protein, partial [Streptococcus suis]
MRRKQFNKDFDEVSRKTRVKMHKSGKNWVKTIVSQLGLFRVSRAGQSAPVRVKLEKQDTLNTNSLGYLKSVMTAGVLVGGSAVLHTTTYADEITAEVASETQTGETLISQEIVEIVTSEVTVDNDLDSVSQNSSAFELRDESLNNSNSLLNESSGDALVSESVSVSESTSASESVSVSESTSASESVSVSESTSASESASASESTSFSESDHFSESESASSSEVANEKSISSGTGSSVSSSTNVDTFDTIVKTEETPSLESVSVTDTTIENQTLASTSENISLTIEEANIVAENTATAAVATTIALAPSTGSSENSETESAIDAALDYSKLDQAILALEDALSKLVPISVDTSSSQYAKYQTALANARLALDTAQALRSDSNATQSQIDSQALLSAQAAITLAGRYSQLVPSASTVEGSGFRAIVNNGQTANVIYGDYYTWPNYYNGVTGLGLGPDRNRNDTNRTKTYASALDTPGVFTFDSDFTYSIDIANANVGANSTSFGWGFVFTDANVDPNSVLASGSILRDSGLADIFGFKIDTNGMMQDQTDKTVSLSSGTSRIAYGGFMYNTATGSTQYVTSGVTITNTNKTTGRTTTNLQPTGNPTKSAQSKFNYSGSSVNGYSYGESFNTITFSFSKSTNSLSVNYLGRTWSTNISQFNIDPSKEYNFLITQEKFADGESHLIKMPANTITESQSESASVVQSESASNSVSTSTSSSVRASTSASASVSARASASASTSASTSASASASTSVSVSTRASASASASASTSVSVSTRASTSASASASTSVSVSTRASASASASTSASASISASASESVSASASASESTSVSASASVSESVSASA